MKPGFVLIIGTLLVCFSFGSALGDGLSKQCPDPKLEYEKSWSGEEYWLSFIFGHISEWVRGKKYLCAKFRFQPDHDIIETGIILIALKKVENRKEKESGLIQGITFIFRQYDPLLAGKNKEVPSVVYEEFYRIFRPRVEIVTGLKFETAEEWFEWWEKNKGRLVLSKDGKHLVVKK